MLFIKKYNTLLIWCKVKKQMCLYIFAFGHFVLNMYMNNNNNKGKNNNYIHGVITVEKLDRKRSTYGYSGHVNDNKKVFKSNPFTISYSILDIALLLLLLFLYYRDKNLQTMTDYINVLMNLIFKYDLI